MGKVLFDAFKYLIPICLGAMVVVFLMDKHEGVEIDPYGIMARGFYYGVIVFAVMHLANKKKMLDREAAANDAKEAPTDEEEAPADEDEADNDEEETPGDEEETPKDAEETSTKQEE